MFIKKDGTFVRTDIWREGEYLDLWSVPHFLSGMVVAFSLFFLNYTGSAAFVIAFLLLVAYEMFEVIAQIEETRWNRILDVVVGMTSFTLTFLLTPSVPISWAIGVFAVVVVLDSILSFFGWSASRKAAILEAKLRVEYTRERERFMLRKQQLGEKWQRRRSKYRRKRIEVEERNA